MTVREKEALILSTSGTSEFQLHTAEASLLQRWPNEGPCVFTNRKRGGELRSPLLTFQLGV